MRKIQPNIQPNRDYLLEKATFFQEVERRKTSKRMTRSDKFLLILHIDVISKGKNSCGALADGLQSLPAAQQPGLYSPGSFRDNAI
jgi:hypothetical protein